MNLERRKALRVLGLSAMAGLAGSSAFSSALAAIAKSASVRPPDVELELGAAPGEVKLLPGKPTRVWCFTARLVRGPADTLQPITDSTLGPVIRLRRGQRVRIRFHNELGEPSIVHWHGLDVPESADGHPRLAVGHGQSYTYDFEVTNRAGTYWYHPHPHMRTAVQVYQGLAGLLIVSDPEEKDLDLPGDAGELLCVLQDRRLDADNQLVYAGASGEGRGRGGGGMGGMMETMNGWLGDRMLVSGRVQPTIDVDRRAYRVRLLNGSNARIYKLAWSDRSPMTLIGSDGGLLEKARTQAALTLAPGQRAEVLLDLSAHAGAAPLQLLSLAFPAGAVGRVGMMAESSPVPQGAALTLMTLRISETKGPGVRLPKKLSTHNFRKLPNAPVRPVPLTFMRMSWLIDGRSFDMQDVAKEETVAPNSTHVWEFENQPNPMGMEMAHPIHVHGLQFRVLARSGGAANPLREGINDTGWLDTVLVLPGEKVRVQIKFSSHPGLYLYHCHILEHEDMGMMRNFRITGTA
ncbi:MAG: multicopper oxidase domain-containing protein [Verrucomicrobia bacterium]|nr:multicopper oxidase domain-containing protein [Verrucomicrobiota bacterium]